MLKKREIIALVIFWIFSMAIGGILVSCADDQRFVPETPQIPSDGPDAAEADDIAPIRDSIRPPRLPIVWLVCWDKHGNITRSDSAREGFIHDFKGRKVTCEFKCRGDWRR